MTSVQVLIQLAHAYIGLTDTAGARAALRQAHDILQQRPDLGVLSDRVADLQESLTTIRAGALGASALTTAELRLVPLLATHLNARRFGERLYVSRNTVKTQVSSITRSSRCRRAARPSTRCDPSAPRRLTPGRNRAAGRRASDQAPSCSRDTLAEFERTGIAKIEGVFTADEAARMRDVVWGELRARYGIERDDHTTWDRHPPTGMRSSKKHRAFAPTRGPALAEAFDQLFGPDAWARPKHYGQVLVTMPNAPEWGPDRALARRLRLHAAPSLIVRGAYRRCSRRRAGGGATRQLAGSHRIARRFIAGRPREELEYKHTRDRIMRSHPWLKALCTADDDYGRNARFMAAETDIDGIPARVVECTGRAGDVYVTHPWVMHAIAPNASDQPRFMRSMGVYCATASPGPHELRNDGAVVV